MVQECLLLIFWRSGPFRFFKNIISAISKIQNVSQKAKFYLKSVGGGDSLEIDSMEQWKITRIIQNSIKNKYKINKLNRVVYLFNF